MATFQTETYLPSAARTALVTGADIQVPLGATAVVFEIESTVDPAAASITPTIQGKALSGAYYTLLVGAAIAAVGVVRLMVGPRATAAANLAANAILPDVIRLNIAVADTDSFTYSVRYKFVD